MVYDILLISTHNLLDEALYLLRCNSYHAICGNNLFDIIG